MAYGQKEPSIYEILKKCGVNPPRKMLRLRRLPPDRLPSSRRPDANPLTP